MPDINLYIGVPGRAWCAGGAGSMDRSSVMSWAEVLSPSRGLIVQPGAMAYRVIIKSTRTPHSTDNGTVMKLLWHWLIGQTLDAAVGLVCQWWKMCVRP